MKLVASPELPKQVIQCLCETAPSHLSIGAKLFRLNEPLLTLKYFIEVLENLWERSTERLMHPIQPGDLEKTVACIEKIKKYCNYSAQTEIEVGLEKFVN